MMKALLSVRFRAMLAGMTAQTRQKKKKSKGMIVLFAFLYVYVAVVIVGAMCMLFSQLAPAYHQLGMDWLYFSMAGLMGLGMSVFGSVFMTQNQLYDAKDNDMLLSMPIRPSAILLSRMIPLLGFNLLFCGIVMVPAFVMFAVLVKFSLGRFLLQLLGMIGVCLLSQAVSCLLGWLLHLLLGRVNKSLASVLYMVVFLGVYFSVYSQAGNIMSAMATSGAAIGAALKSWVWPLYALGVGCCGSFALFAAFQAICAAVFGLVYWLLSVTFLRTATARRSVKKRRLNMAGLKTGSASQAIVSKEWRHFLGSPVYLTNLGLGVVMAAALAVAGIIFRGKLLGMLDSLAAQGLNLSSYVPLAICGLLSFLTSLMFVSAPSVSLEGKNLWILKSMPVSSRRILLAKLKFHCLLTTPVSTLSGLVLAVTYGCGPVEIVLCGAVPGLLTVLCGVLGMVCGLKWAKLDWLSEAYPCKQGIAAMVTMFAMMGVPIVLGLCYVLLEDYLAASMFLTLCALVLAAAGFGLYRVMVTWGVRKWDSL